MDRYLRNTRDLVSSQVVRKPSLRGGQSLELTFLFSEKERHGNLVWDVAPRLVKRVRFSVFNPNDSDLAIKLQVILSDTQGRSWQPEPVILKADDWTEIEFNLAGCRVAKGKEVLDASDAGEPVVSRLTFKFEVDRYFSEFGEPVSLVFDGLELF